MTSGDNEMMNKVFTQELSCRLVNKQYIEEMSSSAMPNPQDQLQPVDFFHWTKVRSFIIGYRCQSLMI